MFIIIFEDKAIYGLITKWNASTGEQITKNKNACACG